MIMLILIKKLNYVVILLFMQTHAIVDYNSNS